MQIGKVAKTLAISPSKIRYYESLGLISAQRLANGYREYSPEMVSLLRTILQAKSLGFSLTEIQKMSHIFQDLGQNPRRVRSYLEEKIADLDQKIEELEAFKHNIFNLLNTRCPL